MALFLDKGVLGSLLRWSVQHVMQIQTGRIAPRRKSPQVLWSTDLLSLSLFPATPSFPPTERASSRATSTAPSGTAPIPTL